MNKKYIAIDWMADFRCIGAECPMTCCGGWNILVSEQERKMYRDLADRHPFGGKILDALDEENGFFKQCGGRCQLLTEEGWCEIVLQCGEQYLSDTCALFPRMLKEYGNIYESLVEIVCPVVTERLCSNEKITFYSDALDDCLAECEADCADMDLYAALSLSRSFLIELFQGYDAAYAAGKLYLFFSTYHAVKEMYGKGGLNQAAMSQWLERWNCENCNTVFDAVAPVAGRVELKAVKLLELVARLLSGDVLDVLLYFLKNNTLKEDFIRWVQDHKSFEKDIQEYSAWYALHYHFLFENYFVYVLFREWIPANLDMEKFGESFCLRVIMWCLIQMCAMSVWRINKEMGVKEYVTIITGIERTSVHNSKMLGSMKELLEKEDNIAQLLLYLIC